MLAKHGLNDILLNNDYFAFVNQILLALTNGLVTSKITPLLRCLFRLGIREGIALQQEICWYSVWCDDPGGHHDRNSPGNTNETHMNIHQDFRPMAKYLKPILSSC